MREIYVLADCYDESISMKVYDTYDDAFKAMKKELDMVFGFDTMDKAAAKEHGHCFGDDYMIRKWDAWYYIGDIRNDLAIKKFEV